MGGHDPHTGFLPLLTGTVAMMWRLWGNNYVQENSVKNRNITEYLYEKVTVISQAQACSLSQQPARHLLQRQPRQGARAQGHLQPPVTYPDHLQPPC